MVCNRLQWLKLLSGKNKKQKKKEVLILVAITFHEKADKRDVTALQGVQVQDDKNISTKAAAEKRCRSSFNVPRWQLAQLQVKGSQEYYRVRTAELQREAPGHRKGSSTWGTAKQFKTFREKKRRLNAQKGTWQWHFCLQWACFIWITTWRVWYLTCELLTSFSHGWLKFPSKSLQAALVQTRSVPSYSDSFGLQRHTGAS